MSWKLIKSTLPVRLWSKEPACPGCAYLLVGLPSEGRCPECGGGYTEASSHLSPSRTASHLRRAVGWYLAAIVVLPMVAAQLGGVVPGLRVSGSVLFVLLIAMVPVVCARLVGGVTALVVEKMETPSGWVAMVMLVGIIVAALVLMYVSLGVFLVIFAIIPRVI